MTSKAPAHQEDHRDDDEADDYHQDPSGHDIVADQVAGPSTAPQAATGQPPTLRQRDPPTLSGLYFEDVDDWLGGLERISHYNRWDASTRMNNVTFSLTGVAKKWFINHEAKLQDWPTFCARFRDLFGRPTSHVAEAQQKLSYRAQQSSESYIVFIEHIVALCKRMDPRMPESEKIKHIMRGIREEAFQLLLLKSPSTVNEAMWICETLQDARIS